MQERVHKIQPDMARLIEQTVRESMEKYALKTVTVRAGEDHDGDPVIRIEATYDLSETPIDSADTAGLTMLLCDKLGDLGETRFPHVRHKFHDRQEVKTRQRSKR
jgi:hypothetical protein